MTKKYLSGEEREMYTFILTVIILVGVFVVLSFGFTQGWEPAYVVPIASLNDNSQVSGHFTLGSGSIKSEPVFVVYSELRNGGYQLETYPADQCTIYMDNTTFPHIQVHNAFISFYSLRMPMIAYTKYDIHVPKGTIVQQYRLDGQI